MIVKAWRRHSGAIIAGSRRRLIIWIDFLWNDEKKFGWIVCIRSALHFWQRKHCLLLETMKKRIYTGVHQCDQKKSPKSNKSPNLVTLVCIKGGSKRVI